MFKQFIFALVLLFIVSEMSGQIGSLRGLVTNYIETGSYNEQIETSIPMYVTEPVNGIFTTQEFAEQFPHVRILEERFQIDYPVMTGYSDTLYIFWFLRDVAFSDRGVTNLIVVGLKENGELHYFIDNNNDYIYSGDETSFSFTPEEPSRKIVMTYNGKNEYLLGNPLYSPPEKNLAERVEIIDSWDIKRRKVNPYFTGAFSFGNGEAAISYVPVNPAVNKLEYFAGIFASLRLSVGVGVEYRGLDLRGWVAAEILDYDEIHRNEYVDGDRNVVYNKGVWMKNKLYAGIEVAYKFKLTQMLFLGPGIGWSWWHTVGNKPIDPELSYDPSARYYNTSTLEYFIKMEILASQSSKIELRLFSSDTSLDAIDFFPDYSSDYKSRYKQIYFGAGFIHSF